MATYRARAIEKRPLALRKLAGIRGKDIAGFIHEREMEGMNPHTIKLDLGIISRVFELARTSWGMESLQNPVALARAARPKLPPGRKRRLEPGEGDELLARAKAYGGMIGPIIVLALETAMRRGEIAGMRWEQVDWGNRVIHLEETKNGERRDVPLSSRALEVLKGLPRRLDGSVFGMTADAISQAFARITARAAMGKKSQSSQALEPMVDLRFHDLRHEATSRLFEKGFNPMEVAAITGHKTLEMLKRYTHLRAEDLAKRLG
ncbi:MAG: site-specific integrase [Gammaproteobacteria bacterium]